MIRQNNKIFVLYIITSMLVFIQTPLANAANIAPYDNRVTSREKAVFAFFNAAGTSPDYNYWIKSKPTYQSLPVKSQDRYLLNETLRLGSGYGAFDQNKDLIELNINVLAKYIPAKDGEKPRILFKFFNSSKEYVPSFSYPYGNESLSLIINNLAAFSDMPLNEAQNLTILQKIPYEDEIFDASLTVHVRVDRANHKKPISKEPNVQWLMIGEIGYLRCDVSSYNTSGKSMLWDYVSPWHKEEYRMKNTSDEEKYPHPYDLFKD